MSLDAENRSSQLLEILRRDGEIRTSVAAEQLNVSPLTIRRDIAALAEEGLVRAVRGGAKPASFEKFSARNLNFSSEKSVVARKTRKLVPKSGVICIDSSSTTYRLCRLLDMATDLTVVTNCPMHLQALQNKPGITPILTGGRFNAGNDSFIGQETIRFISGFKFDYFFASVAAFDSQRGGFESAASEAEVKQAFMTSSERIVLGLNSAKTSLRAPFSSFAPEQIDVLVTELPAKEFASMAEGLPNSIQVV